MSEHHCRHCCTHKKDRESPRRRHLSPRSYKTHRRYRSPRRRYRSPRRRYYIVGDREWQLASSHDRPMRRYNSPRNPTSRWRKRPSPWVEPPPGMPPIQIQDWEPNPNVPYITPPPPRGNDRSSGGRPGSILRSDEGCVCVDCTNWADDCTKGGVGIGDGHDGCTE